jgi:hypothetical protein
MAFFRFLQRILDATAFSNVSHLRDFEELLEAGRQREARESSGAASSDARAPRDTSTA